MSAHGMPKKAAMALVDWELAKNEGHKFLHNVGVHPVILSKFGLCGIQITGWELMFFIATKRLTIQQMRQNLGHSQTRWEPLEGLCPGSQQ